ncbi:MAG: DUF1214 domain-containing protein [Deltaproteobacteria bacterium]|nr:DUF1214 domain-containing protein [Deltaproteobacteria bacterium]MBW2359976.1 DUF1214 domain-containing protein [Deltaproteobacteria bacterium]
MKRLLTIALVALLALVAFAAGFAAGKGPRLMTMLLTGGGAADPAWQRLESVQAFDQLMGSVDDVRNMVLAEAESEREVVQGMRWILRNIAETTDIAADANPLRPDFVRMDTTVRKIGGDNADGEYHVATIDGRHDYRITGNRGSVRYFSLNVNAGRGMTRRRMAAFLNDRTIEFDEQGNFTLLLSQERPQADGQWVQIPEDASIVMLRQYVADRDREELVSISIGPLGEAPPLPDTRDTDVADAMTAMNYAFVTLASLHKLVLPQAWERPNEFFSTDSDSLGGSISTPDNLYMIGSFEVARDQALIIEVQPPQTRYWNIALETHWHETVEHLYRPTSRTLEDVTAEADGKVRFVIAHRDPGVPNWLDPMGNERGFMTLRWLDARDATVPTPVITRVPLAELSDALALAQLESAGSP